METTTASAPVPGVGNAVSSGGDNAQHRSARHDGDVGGSNHQQTKQADLQIGESADSAEEIVNHSSTDNAIKNVEEKSTADINVRERSYVEDVPSQLNDSPSMDQNTNRFLDKEKIEKAEAFLRNSEIHDVPTSSKRKYLETKIGMTQREIDTALERVTVPLRENVRARQPRDIRADRDNRRRQYDDGLDDEGDFRRPTRRNLNEFKDERDRYDFDERPRHNSISARRHLGHDTGEFSQPPYNNPNDGSMNAFNLNSMANDQHIHQREESSAASSFFSVPAWAGGFSLGVFCLAALRWLNGGDFVLFPPPTATVSKQHVIKCHRQIGIDDDDDENTDEASGSLHDEEVEAAHLGDYQQNEMKSDEEYEEGHLEEEDTDDGINMILNGTANATSLHPSPTQPSYEELVLEIRSLTSTIHSYHRATSAQVGRVMTDDAMDFLRMKKSTSTFEKDKAGAEAAGLQKSIKEEEVVNICSLLTEVTEELSQLKESASQTETANERSPSLKGDVDGENAEKADDVDKVNEEKHSTNAIDNALAKIHKVLLIVQKPEPSKDDMPPAKEESESIQNDSSPTASGSPLPDNEVAESVIQSADPSKQTDTEPSTNNDDLEEALKTLSNGNDAQELKVGAQMLYLYCLNISKNPTVPRYRKIYTNNNNFRNKVGNLVGAKEFLRAVGFAERTNFFEWALSDDGSSDTKSRLDFALVALEMLRNGSKNNDDGTASSPSQAQENFPAAEIAAPSAASISSAAVTISNIGKKLELN